MAAIHFPFELPQEQLTPDDCPLAASVDDLPLGTITGPQLNGQLFTVLAGLDQAAGFLPANFRFAAASLTAEQAVNLLVRKEQRRFKQVTAERQGTVSFFTQSLL
jgi:hypothetical protein